MGIVRVSHLLTSREQGKCDGRGEGLRDKWRITRREMIANSLYKYHLRTYLRLVIESLFLIIEYFSVNSLFLVNVK